MTKNLVPSTYKLRSFVYVWHSAVKHGRRFYGCEIKPEYYAEACKNLQFASSLQEEPSLFSEVA